MKKIMSILLAVFLLATFTACSGSGDEATTDSTDNSSTSNSTVVTDTEKPDETKTATKPEKPVEGGTVSTDGSTSMEKVIGFLSEAYTEKNGNVKVTSNPTGSGSGIQAVLEGRCDIGLSSRNLKDEEKENLNATVVAIDGIAIIVNPANTVEDLTIEQIAKIYTGEVTNWSEVGGSDSPIVPIGREAAS